MDQYENLLVSSLRRSSVTSGRLPLLNEDIYHALFDLLDDQGDVSALMRSSWTLYFVGIKRLLRLGVSIYTDEELVGFCQFMARNLPRCADFLTSLFICIERNRIDNEILSRYTYELDDSDDSADLLEGAPLLLPTIAQCTSLQNLTIHFCEELLECDDRLMEAFASLTTLRQLRVSSFGLRTYDFVSTVRSPIVDIHVGCEALTQDVIWSQFLILPDPFIMLRQHCTTLERISLRAVDTTELFVYLDGTPLTVFPRVHTLAIGGSRVLERTVLVDAFPNLRSLEVINTVFDYLYMENPPTEEEAHEMNRDDEDEDEVWPYLDHLSGDADSLYVLGVNRPVGRLDIACDFRYDYVEHLHETIEDLHPPRLLIRRGYNQRGYDGAPGMLQIQPVELEDVLSSLLPAELHEITHFGLDVGIPGIGDTEPIRYQKAIVQLLSQLRIRFFAFRLHEVALEEEDEYEYGEPHSQQTQVVLAKFQGKFLAFWAARIAEAVPSLCFLAFHVMDREVYWDVARDARGAPVFTRVGVHAGREKTALEKMVWHRFSCRDPYCETLGSDYQSSKDDMSTESS
ncbi:hypothetical protein BD413DRAFT_722529 [Trametes elegans]|nr:hypothetical protein BD413DRAFT_722529 [Trametes elegans]